jgi:hypothetical protein
MKFHMKEVKLNEQTSSSMLKSEIKRLYESQTEKKKEQHMEVNKKAVLERKTIVLSELVQKFKQDKLELQKANFQLKSKLEDIEKDYSTLRMQFQHFLKMSEAREGKMWDMKKQVSGTHSLPRASPKSTSLPDIEGIKLQLESTQMEKNLFLSEKRDLEKQLKQLTHQLNTKQIEAQDLIRKSNAKPAKRDYDRILSLLERRCQRTEKIAAHLERQLRKLDDGYKVDYLMYEDAEPSIQLVAAIMTKV